MQRIGHSARVIFGLLLVAAAVMFAVPGGTARAQQDDGSIIKARVQNRADGAAKPVPVPGVRIVVTTPDGASVAEGITDDKGLAELMVPGGGKYVVMLDEDSLPEGIGVTGGAKAERDVTVTSGLGGNANFNLGSVTGGRKSKLDLLPQTLANGLQFGLIIALASIGLSLIYGTTGLSNFSHGELVTLGAVTAWYIDDRWRIFGNASSGAALGQVAVAAAGGMLVTAAFSGALERAVWRPLRNRGVGLTSMAIVSIGLAIFLRYLVQSRFGGQPKPYKEFISQRQVNIGPIGITPRDIITSVLCALVLLGIAGMLIYTRTGKAMRAVSDNPDLSSASGINVDRIILIVWMLGGALAAFGGVLYGLDQSVKWDNGLTLLLLMFAAITLGGLGRPFGALVGSLIIGMAVNLWAWLFNTVSDLKNIGALGALIIILLVRPQGILGRKERIG